MSLYVRGQDGGLLPVRDVAPGPELYEKEIEELAWNNLELFAGEALFPLCRRATLPGGGIPDILALDSLGRVWIIEVKRDVDRHQLSQALEYAGWARSTNLDEVSELYPDEVAAFFSEWLKFTESATPVVVNRSPRFCSSPAACIREQRTHCGSWLTTGCPLLSFRCPCMKTKPDVAWLISSANPR